MKWPLRRRSRWIDHQCRWPSQGRKAVPGDRWQCRCGRVWRLVKIEQSASPGWWFYTGWQLDPPTPRGQA